MIYYILFYLFFCLLCFSSKEAADGYIVACGWEVVGGHVNSGVVLCPCPGTLGGSQ